MILYMTFKVIYFGYSDSVLSAVEREIRKNGDTSNVCSNLCRRKVPEVAPVAHYIVDFCNSNYQGYSSYSGTLLIQN